MASPARRRPPRRGGEHDGEHEGHRDGARGDPQNEGHRDNANPDAAGEHEALDYAHCDDACPDAAGEHEGHRDRVPDWRRPARSASGRSSAMPSALKSGAGGSCLAVSVRR